MDPVHVARSLSTALSPFLPYLLQAGEKAAEAAGEKFGVDVWNEAKKLWSKLRPHIQERPVALSAAQELALAPHDEDASAALRAQLRKLLQEHPHLAAELEPQAESLRSHVQMIVSGTRAVGTAGDMHGGSVHTGDIIYSSERKRD